MSILKFKRKRAKGRAQRRWLSRARRHARVVKKLRGVPERPRLVVYRGLRHLETQLVDDSRGVCITGVSTRAKEVASLLGDERTKTAQSRAAGKLMAERTKAKGIDAIVFDRGGYRYHGRVKAFAEGAREGGLKF